jgi:beta-phosphoglucomutase
MLRAIILDFNGVILDDELLHFAAMRDVVAGYDIDLTRETYWDNYLPLDDFHCLEAICRDYSVQLSGDELAGALSLKTRNYKELLKDQLPLFPGVAHFIRTAAERYPLALASGARREEVESGLDSAGLRRYFVVIVAAEDFQRWKPHPESYLMALERLNAAIDLSPIQPGECLVIEDSPDGVHGAKSAGMTCMAVTNSYPGEKLKAADRIVTSLEDVRLDSLRALFED